MRQSLQIWLLAVLFFAAGLAVFTRQNQFPFFYHPDEWGKVYQVQTADWNFNHPMLMLTTARVISEASGELKNPQRVVEIGRWISAAFAAASVALLAAMAYVTAGRFAGIAAGVLLLTNHQLFELAHYFKEDTALLFGISAWFLAMTLYWKRPSFQTAIWVGIAAALAVSGKYLGLFAPLLSLWLIPHGAAMTPAMSQKRGAMLCAFSVALIAAFALINLPLLLHLTRFGSSLDREVGLVVGGQRGMTRSIPHIVYLTAFRVNVFFVLWTFLFIHVISSWKRRAELSAFDWLVTLFPFVFLAVLSFSPKTNDRYFLPATALFLYAVALGMGDLHRRWAKREEIGPILVGIILLAQLPSLWKYYQAFRIDDRKELSEWLNTHLPPNTVIAQDGRVLLPTKSVPEFIAYQPPLTASVINEDLDKINTVQALRDQGVNYAVLSESDYGRYFQKSLRPKKGGESDHNQSRDFYQQIRSSEPLWQRPRSTVIYLHPGLEVYALPSKQ